MTYPPHIIEKAKRVKLLILDVDGVFTNGQVWLSSNGDEVKVFHTQDGYGIKQIRRHNITVAIISGRNSKSCDYRMKELGVEHIHQGIHDKLPVFKQLLETVNVTGDDCAYVGDDIPDMPLMQRVGLKIAVANATAPVKAIADWETIKEGGHGAVRDVCDLLIHAQGMPLDYVT
ncbi:MAG: 3-deoxy-D-manno-octulosonate 8-phosphate phosphatase [Coxiella sp. (in: Bacteria)]|nr:MAG: 3-deoxy-D-manno-octulosonate 8-phosphate phosphatase [Coxiella sp. (in: g-proteobacteria)]